jgi:hypothetical protein
MALPAPAATTPTRTITAGWQFGAASPWLWALGSLGWFVASAYLTLPLVTAIPAQFLLQPLIWGAAVLAGTLVLARGAFGRWLPVSWSALTLAVVGLTLAGLLDESLHGWALGRFGVFDWDLLGPTAGLFALLVGSSVAGFGVLVAPRGASLPPLVFAVGGAVLSGLVVAINMPGLGDGLGADSVLPALLVGAGGAYALAVAFVAVLVAARRELPDATGERDG